MTLSRLSSKCAKCPKVDTCDHKRMEMVGFLEPTGNVSQEKLSENAAVPHKYRNVKIAPNTEITIDLEDIKKRDRTVNSKTSRTIRRFFQKLYLTEVSE